MSKIPWTDTTWNPVRGCAKVSPGCKFCYAMGQAHRFSGAGQPYEGLTRLGAPGKGGQWTGKVRMVPEMLTKPLSWRKPRRVFVCSMSDLFHEGVSDDFITAVFRVMAECPRHTFQVLTKRPERMLTWYLGHMLRSVDTPWPLPNVHVGVSAEDQFYWDLRVPTLLLIPAARRFVSVEPMLGPVDVRRDVMNGPPVLSDIDQVIIGCESRGAHLGRPTEIGWIRDLGWQVLDAGVKLFVKQAAVCTACHGRARNGCLTNGTGSMLTKTPKFWIPGHGYGPWTEMIDE